MNKKAIVFVTNYKDKISVEFETLMKNLYLQGKPEDYPCLTFFHGNSDNTVIADKVKNKKPVAVIFDSVNPETRISVIKKMINHRMNGSSPDMINTGIEVKIEGVTFIPDREKIYQLLTA